MLDVHPPHQATHTWTDFFIHIATIVVGLLIAVGIEQTVEWLHHKAEIRETRQLLKEERAENVKLFHENVTNLRQEQALLNNDLRIFQYLQQHPGASLDSLPGVLEWSDSRAPFQQASWISAKQSNILALMPQAEVEESRDLYEMLSESDAQGLAMWDADDKANEFRFVQPDISKLTHAQVDAEIILIEDYMRVSSRQLTALFNISGNYSDFYPGPHTFEATKFARTVVIDPKEYPSAYAFTKADLDSAESFDKADRPDLLFVKEFSERGSSHISEAYDVVRTKFPGYKPRERVLDEETDRLLQIDEIPTAITVAQFEAKLYPDNWNTWDSIGELYAKAGKKKLAIENYQHALKLNPKAESSIEALEKLQQ